MLPWQWENIQIHRPILTLHCWRPAGDCAGLRDSDIEVKGWYLPAKLSHSSVGDKNVLFTVPYVNEALNPALGHGVAHHPWIRGPSRQTWPVWRKDWCWRPGGRGVIRGKGQHLQKQESLWGRVDWCRCKELRPNLRRGRRKRDHLVWRIKDGHKVLDIPLMRRQVHVPSPWDWVNSLTLC